MLRFDKNGESEAGGVVQEFHGFGVGVAFRVIDMDIDKVLVDGGADSLVGVGKFGKSQAPGAPVAPHLAQHIFALFTGL